MLKVILIGYEHSLIRDFLSEKTELIWIDGHEIITLEMLQRIEPDYIVSHACQSILSHDIVNYYRGKILNCHGSILPYNRGTHPNIWSFIDDTPKGGTIHLINEDIDEGDILAQCEIQIFDTDTLADTYYRIKDSMEHLFINIWEDFISGNISPRKQDLTKGKLHYRKDLKTIDHLLIKGWDTPVKLLKDVCTIKG